MYRVINKDDSTVIETRSRFVQVGSIFFLALGALNVVAGFLAARPGELLGPGVVCLAVGALYGFVPFRTIVRIDRGQGAFSIIAQSLFRTKGDREKLEELESVVIVPSTYYWFFEATYRGGGQTRLFGQLKNTWTWNRTPSADIVARGQEVAGLLGVPLKT